MNEILDNKIQLSQTYNLTIANIYEYTIIINKLFVRKYFQNYKIHFFFFFYLISENLAK